MVRSELRVLGEGTAAPRETEDRRVERMAPRREEVVTILAYSLTDWLLHQQDRARDKREERKVSEKD